MGFFYISIFSLVFIAVVYAVALWLFHFIWVRIYKRKFSGPVVWGVVALVLVAPWVEEIWIAWNFGQLCRTDAGLFIYKSVEVDGFYDDTHGWRPDKLRVSGFKWVEGRASTVYESTYWRHEGTGQEIRSFKIDQPTARYRYQRTLSHTPVAYRIKAFEWIVEDIESESAIAREKAYAREPYWFYIGLSRPTLFCPVFGDSGEKLTGELFRRVLRPTK